MVSISPIERNPDFSSGWDDSGNTSQKVPGSRDPETSLVPA